MSVRVALHDNIENGLAHGQRPSQCSQLTQIISHGSGETQFFNFLDLPLGTGSDFVETLALLSDANHPREFLAESILVNPEMGLLIEMKKVSSFLPLAVDNETKIHILGPSRAGMKLPARFLIG